MTNPLSPELIAWGATFTPGVVTPGQPYWRLVQATGPINIGGNHHLYVDVRDEAGQRVVGAEVIFFSDSEEWPSKTEAKTGEPFCANLPMTAGGHAYGVRMGDDLPSDSLFGVGLGSYVPHHCFTAIFQRSIAGGVQIPPVVTPIVNVKATLEQIRKLADDALGAL